MATEITLNRIQYTDRNGNVAYFSFADLSDPDAITNMANYRRDLESGTSNLRQKIRDYVKNVGSDQFKKLWDLPSPLLPYQTDPIGEFPGYIESLPTTVDPAINQKVAQINKTPVQDYLASQGNPIPIHPGLSIDRLNPPNVAEIDPDLPPFYNNYVQAKNS
jgi:hypothetical protein